MTPAGDLHQAFVAGSTPMFRLGKSHTGRLLAGKIYDELPADPDRSGGTKP
jgi:hypothetical protein